MRKAIFATLLFSVVLLASATPAQSQTVAGVAARREVTLSIKVVFVGFDPDTIDTSYLAWSENVPSELVNAIQTSGQETGVLYRFRYNFVFSPDPFKSKLISFMRSIEERSDRENPWFRYFTQEKSVTVRKFHSVTNVFYDANRVENWFYENRGEFGGLPENGYTIIISNLIELPSTQYSKLVEFWGDTSKRPGDITPHYLKVTFADEDRGYALPNTEFMKAWGGHYRFWFLDVSAGPTFFRATYWDDLPLHVVAEDQGFDFKKPEGKRWLTRYLADYVTEFVYDLAAPQYVYDPQLADNYRFVIHVIEGRTKEQSDAVPVKGLINDQLIRAAFEQLIPYAKISVEVQFRNLGEYVGLDQVLKQNERKIDTYMYNNLFFPPFNGVVYEFPPIYQFMQNNLARFVPDLKRDSAEVVIPAFAFLLSQGRFSWGYKWYIGRLDPETETFGGIALGDMAVVALNHGDFVRGDAAGQQGKGIGLTQFVIHELGHMVGLMHPHSYGWIGDFVVSAMGYYTWDYVFGQFDRDALQRIHADKLLMQTSTTLQKAKTLMQSKVSSSDMQSQLLKAESLARDAEGEYSKMNYVNAFGLAKQAKQAASNTLDGIEKLPAVTKPLEDQIKALSDQLASERINNLTIGIVVGIIAGLAAGVAVTTVLKKRSQVLVPKNTN